MSSMRNAVQRRNHRERAQPTERSKWGILEKHKDYSLRAADYNKKKTRLRALRAKAKDRNPDEFYFGMMNPANKTSRATGTRFGDRGNEVLKTETVRLLKTQDTAYLRTVGMRAKREVGRMEEGVLLGESMRGLGGNGDGVGEHVVFVGSREEQKGYGGKAVEAGEVGDGDDEEMEMKKRERKRREKEQEKKKARLEAARERAREIEKAEREVELQRTKMTKTGSRGGGGVNKNGVAWKVKGRKK